jgi:hypothetical protein
LATRRSATEHHLAARSCLKVNLPIEPGNHAVMGLYQRLRYTMDDLVFMEPRRP